MECMDVQRVFHSHSLPDDFQRTCQMGEFVVLESVYLMALIHCTGKLTLVLFCAKKFDILCLMLERLYNF